jgi:hypothetical protein
MTEERKLILLSDFLETKLRKEKELEFYERELAKLQRKMFWLKRDIDLNNTIIDLIKKEAVLDIREEMERKYLNKNDDSE